MNQQLQILTGDQLAIQGLNNAVQKADRDYSDWSTRCWQLFLKWLSKKPVGYEFKIENFRTDCEKWGKIETPHSLRAYGFVSRRAEKEGLITGAGTSKATNIKAHATPVNVWKKL